jgi:hypothetical protein
MEVGQGPNWGCSAKGKKKNLSDWKHQEGEHTGIPTQMLQYKQGAGGQFHYKTYDRK